MGKKSKEQKDAEKAAKQQQRYADVASGKKKPRNKAEAAQAAAYQQRQDQARNEAKTEEQLGQARGALGEAGGRAREQTGQARDTFLQAGKQLGQDYRELEGQAAGSAQKARDASSAEIAANQARLSSATTGATDRLDQDLSAATDRMDQQYGATRQDLDDRMGAATGTLRDDFSNVQGQARQDFSKVGRQAGRDFDRALDRDAQLMQGGTSTVRDDFGEAQGIAQQGLLDRRASQALQGMRSGQDAAAAQQFAQARASGGGGLAMRNAGLNAGNIQAQLAGQGAMARASEAAAGYGQMGQAAAQRGAATSEMVRAQAQNQASLGAQAATTRAGIGSQAASTQAGLGAQAASQSADMSQQTAMTQAQLGQDQAQQELSARMQQSGRVADTTMQGAEMQNQASQAGMALQAGQDEAAMARQAQMGENRIQGETAQSNQAANVNMQQAQNELAEGANIANTYGAGAQAAQNYNAQQTGMAQQQYANPQANQSVWNKITEAVVPSDERAKTNINRSVLNPTMDKILENLDAATFDYKNSQEDGAGPQVGVMAQSLQKTPEGAGMVLATPKGLMVDTRKATMLNLAALKYIDERLRAVEGRGGSSAGQVQGRSQAVGGGGQDYA